HLPGRIVWVSPELQNLDPSHPLGVVRVIMLGEIRGGINRGQRDPTPNGQVRVGGDMEDPIAYRHPLELSNVEPAVEVLPYQEALQVLLLLVTPSALSDADGQPLEQVVSRRINHCLRAGNVERLPIFLSSNY